MPFPTQAPPLPSPPFLQHYLFEEPWPAAGLLLVAALGAAWWLRRQNQPRRAALAALTGAALTAVVLALGALVTTEREVLAARTRDAVEAAARVDEPALRDLAFESVTASVPGVSLPAGRDDLIATARRYLTDHTPLKSHRVRAVSATLDGPNVARTQALVQIELAAGGKFIDGPIGTRWELRWRRDPLPDGGFGPWRVSSVHALQLGAFSGPPPSPE
jgi:hypothetical protein